MCVTTTSSANAVELQYTIGSLLMFFAKHLFQCNWVNSSSVLTQSPTNIRPVEERRFESIEGVWREQIAPRSAHKRDQSVPTRKWPLTMSSMRRRVFCANSTCSLEPMLAISAGFGYFGYIQHAYLQICIVVTVIVYMFDYVWLGFPILWSQWSCPPMDLET